MILNGNQRRGLHMIERGFRPHRSTVNALFNKGLVVGSIEEPHLNDAGERFVRFGELPTSAG